MLANVKQPQFFYAQNERMRPDNTIRKSANPRDIIPHSKLKTPLTELPRNFQSMLREFQGFCERIVPYRKQF